MSILQIRKLKSDKVQDCIVSLNWADIKTGKPKPFCAFDRSCMG